MAELDDEIEQEPPDEGADRRKYLLLLFLLLLKDTKVQLSAIVTAHLSGSLSLYRMQAQVTGLLMDSHAHSAYLGRQLAGVRQPFGRADQQFASTVMFGQVGYLEGLFRDIEAGRYPFVDSELAKALQTRLGLYANVLRETADRAWVRNLPADTLIDWVTTARESCPGCLAQEAENPHRASSMTVFPGGAECGPNCGCYLSVVGGESGFEL